MKNDANCAFTARQLTKHAQRFGMTKKAFLKMARNHDKQNGIGTFKKIVLAGEEKQNAALNHEEIYQELRHCM